MKLSLVSGTSVVVYSILKKSSYPISRYVIVCKLVL